MGGDNRAEGRELESEDDYSIDTCVRHFKTIPRGERCVLAVLHPVLVEYWQRSSGDLVTITGTRRDHILSAHPEFLGREHTIIRALREPNVIRQDKALRQRVTMYVRGFDHEHWLLVVVESKSAMRSVSVITAFPVHDTEVARRRRIEALIWEE